MPLSPDLFDRIDPPQIWITISGVETQEHDTIQLTLRVKEGNKRSISAALPISRYAPTDTIILAVSYAVKAMAIAQAPIDHQVLEQQLEAAVRDYVDPF
jgi:hypothetical protein